MEKYIKHPVYQVIYCIIIFIATCFFLDISGAIKKFFELFSKEDTEIIFVIFDYYIKISISLLLMMCLLVIFIYVNYAFTRYKQKYDARMLFSTSEIDKNNSPAQVLKIIGYSLSFADQIAIQLRKGNYMNLTVIIFVPDPQFIEENIVEIKPIKTRLEVLSGRLCEWKKLKEENKIKELKIYYYKDIPYEYGIIFNNNYFFHHYNWKWNTNEKKYQLEKVPYEFRKMVKVNKRTDPYMYDFLTSRVGLMENELGGAD